MKNTQNNELYALYKKIDRIEVKVGRLRWLEQLFTMQEVDPCRRLTVVTPEGCRHAGKPELRWLGSVEEDVKKMGVRNWRREWQDRGEWWAIVDLAKVHHGL